METKEIDQQVKIIRFKLNKKNKLIRKSKDDMQLNEPKKPKALRKQYSFHVTQDIKTNGNDFLSILLSIINQKMNCKDIQYPEIFLEVIQNIPLVVYDGSNYHYFDVLGSNQIIEFQQNDIIVLKEWEIFYYLDESTHQLKINVACQKSYKKREKSEFEFSFNLMVQSHHLSKALQSQLLTIRKSLLSQEAKQLVLRKNLSRFSTKAFEDKILDEKWKEEEEEEEFSLLKKQKEKRENSKQASIMSNKINNLSLMFQQQLKKSDKHKSQQIQKEEKFYKKRHLNNGQSDVVEDNDSFQKIDENHQNKFFDENNKSMNSNQLNTEQSNQFMKKPLVKSKEDVQSSRVPIGSSRNIKEKMQKTRNLLQKFEQNENSQHIQMDQAEKIIDFKKIEVVDLEKDMEDENQSICNIDQEEIQNELYDNLSNEFNFDIENEINHNSLQNKDEVLQKSPKKNQNACQSTTDNCVLKMNQPCENQTGQEDQIKNEIKKRKVSQQNFPDDLVFSQAVIQRAFQIVNSNTLKQNKNKDCSQKNQRTIVEKKLGLKEDLVVSKSQIKYLEKNLKI